MQYFYDGQIRRYLTQIIRAFSNFSYKDGDGDLRVVPVTYGDLTRQVSNIIRENSENKLPSAPRMSVYITSMQMDRARLSDSSFVSKINVKERDFDTSAQEYKNQQGKGYTVERLHPTPYTLSVNVDIWSTNTEQKLQILEQIFMLFNPDLEFQTNDNYVDWTSLSVLQLENINFSSRSIPTGTESEIDIATLSFIAPVYISPPTKVKKLGVITEIINSVLNFDAGTIELEGFNPDTGDTTKAATGTVVMPDGTVITQQPSTPPGAVVDDNGQINYKKLTPDDTRATIIKTSPDGNLNVANVNTASYRNFDIIVEGDIVKLGKNAARIGEINWYNVIEAEAPAKYQPGISQIRLKRGELLTPIVATFQINGNNSQELVLNYDIDTKPSDTVITGVTSRGTIDYIINPRDFNPNVVKADGIRLLLLQPIGGAIERIYTVTGSTTRIETEVDADVVYDFDVFVENTRVTDAATQETIDGSLVIRLSDAPRPGDEVRYVLYINEDGADAWKSTSSRDFIADTHDIVEWDGSQWNIIFDASESTNPVYITNLNTDQQFYYNQYYWQYAIDGLYPRGAWDLII
jgi:hypothetical protein